MKKRIGILCLACCFLAGCGKGADLGAERNTLAEDGNAPVTEGGILTEDGNASVTEGDVLAEDGNDLETEGDEQEGPVKPEGSTNEQDDEWGLTLRAESVRPDGCTIVFEQHGGAPSGVEMITGSWFRIEKKDGDTWVEAPYAEGVGEEIAWTDEAWVISFEGSVEFEENWSYLYGELAGGEYRIVKEIMDFRGTGDYDEKYYYAEFTL